MAASVKAQNGEKTHWEFMPVAEAAELVACVWTEMLQVSGVSDLIRFSLRVFISCILIVSECIISVFQCSINCMAFCSFLYIHLTETKMTSMFQHLYSKASLVSISPATGSEGEQNSDVCTTSARYPARHRIRLEKNLNSRGHRCKGCVPAFKQGGENLSARCWNRNQAHRKGAQSYICRAGGWQKSSWRMAKIIHRIAIATQRAEGTKFM